MAIEGWTGRKNRDRLWVEGLRALSSGCCLDGSAIILTVTSVVKIRCLVPAIIRKALGLVGTICTSFQPL